MGNPRVNALEEYKALCEQQRVQPLGPDEAQRLELLRDVLLELGALPPEGSPLPTRPVRADAVLELTFATQDDVVRAYSRNIGAGGLAIRTARALPVGSTLELRLSLPDAPHQPLVAHAQVAWSREDGMGVAFTQLASEAERRLKSFLADDASLLKRVRSVLRTDVRELLTTDVRELGKGPAPQAATAVEVDTRAPVLVRLTEPRLMTLVTELFLQKGVRLATDGDKPTLLVVDTGSALDVLSAFGRPGTRTIMVNVSGPDSLMGRLSNLTPAAFVKHPATAAAVLHAVEKLLSTAAPR
ncbi:PilZ domain-containing protein [Myxococcus sp. K15C18031901]|uniref:PilZ domain-containing protein n=1 Tax=Myxococcus dinghuensis TaxID=2906761 RepID=UPI0020A77586|nr:PilZ domain-containing protein [Myxococcus dinghuensis]MCP3097417.1 PilZ domain-containing protein [Myxococcus dinghuensis]